MPWVRRPEPPIYTFRVRILGGFYAPENARAIQRTIEVAANQTLADLGGFIPYTFEFDDPHLWSFFLSGKRWDSATEYALNPEPDMPDPSGVMQPMAKAAARTRIRDVPYPGKTGKKEFLFLFDFGDEWEFGVKLVGTSDNVPANTLYPRLVDGQGVAPPQYPDLDDEDWDDWDEDGEDADDDENDAGPDGGGPLRLM